MLDHVSLGVTDLERSKAFYDAVLKPLGVSRFYDYEGGLGYGTAADKIQFWIGTPFDAGRPARAGGGTHVAFRAANRKAVDDFHRAALADGAQGRRQARPAADLPPELLRRVRARSGRPQDRSLLPRTSVTGRRTDFHHQGDGTEWH